ncbi:MAG: hypothetical protein Q4E35_00935 [Eubacteriales bacterium]|nr:hypothetical protein [Eubacteriales bacterium]
MRKRILSVLTVMLLAACILSGNAFAYGAVDSWLPQPDGFDYSEIIPSSYDGGVVSGGAAVPVIFKEPSAVYACRGGIPDALRVEATSYDGGFVCYQWYMSYSGSFSDLFPITGANSAAYTPAQTLGTVYYCAGVYNVSGGARSSEVYTNLIPVTYSGIEIVSAPSRTVYDFGSAIDLSGLVVKVYDINGSYWESVNGVGLNVYPSVLNTAGQVAVQVSYNGSSDGFLVNVNAAAAKTTKTIVDGNGNTVEVEVDVPAGPHEHEFGEWEITKSATCVTTGLKTRTCSCGELETEELPRTDHIWDEGIVTKEPTANANGARLYTCTVCKANKSEIIPAGTVTKNVEEQAASLNINGGDPEAPNSTYNSQVTPPPTPVLNKGTLDTTATGASTGGVTASGNVTNNGDSTGWWLIPASALLLVGTGTGAYYLMRKKNSQY